MAMNVICCHMATMPRKGLKKRILYEELGQAEICHSYGFGVRNLM